MKTTGLLTLCLLAATAGCGSSTTATSTGSHTTAGCERVKLGTSGGTTVYASVDRPAHVDCRTAQAVVREWGRQQIGAGEAHLPTGWTCGNGPCRNGNQRVAFTLDYGG